MLLQEFLSRKKPSRKYRSIFGLKNQSCDRRKVESVTHRLDFLREAVQDCQNRNGESRGGLNHEMPDETNPRWK